MMLPMPYTVVIRQPVACEPLERSRASRKLRRRNRYGKQDVFGKLRGEMSPKQMRESGL